MNQILVETHKKDNINLLKVRDYFFDKARNINVFRRFCLGFPILLLIVSYLPILSAYGFVNDYRDYYTGIVTIIMFFVVRSLNSRIQRYLYISNVFREEYDVRVCHMNRNQYIYDYEVLERYKYVADKVADNSKYDYWYEEIFCLDNNKNVICCQMDNVIYTYYAYNTAKKLYLLMLGVGSILAIILWLVIGHSDFIILSILALFNILQMFVEYLDVCNELIENNKILKDKILKSEPLDYTDETVRNIQDCIINNRNNSLFIPKAIRNIYLKDGNPYYNDLNEIRKKLLDADTTTIPSSADEIELVSTDGNRKTKLVEIQKRLKEMLKEVKSVMDAEDIQYTLDGGTLIGAAREEGKFIFWDDDVDLAIRYEDFSWAREVLEKKLGDRFEFQDYENEQFYSPRLSNLRIREQNKYSIVEEKDSPLFELYKSRGLFLDIYVYAPILRNVKIDSFYRILRIHPLNRKIKKIEDRWRSNRSKYSRKFEKYKKKYMKRVNWYLSHAKCDDYYAYTPNYIEDIKHPGPYIKREDLYGENKKMMFEGDEYPVPTNVDVVLKSYYGHSWNKSLFKDIKTLEQEYSDSWYSHKCFSASSLKHLWHGDIQERD